MARGAACDVECKGGSRFLFSSAMLSYERMGFIHIYLWYHSHSHGVVHIFPDLRSLQYAQNNHKRCALARCALKVVFMCRMKCREINKMKEHTAHTHAHTMPHYPLLLSFAHRRRPLSAPSTNAIIIIIIKIVYK